VRAHKKEEHEPDLQAHTNPAYILRGGKPVMIRAARQSLAEQWEDEIVRYRKAALAFTAAQSQEFFNEAEKALAALRGPLVP
jgi:hypothetical protein